MGGVWYSLFIKTNYSFKVRKVAKKSDYSFFINFLSLFIIFLAHSLFIRKRAIIH